MFFRFTFIRLFSSNLTMAPVHSKLFSDLKTILSTILEEDNVRNDFRDLANALLNLLYKKVVMEALVKKNPTEDKVRKADVNVEILNDIIGETIEEMLKEATKNVVVETNKELVVEMLKEWNWKLLSRMK